MEELLQQANNIDYPRLKKTITKLAAEELSKLSDPCYYPEMKKYYFTLLNICKLTEKDIKVMQKRFYKGHKGANFKLTQDPKSNFYIFIMYAFLKKRDQAAFMSTMVFYTIRTYTNLMNKQMKYCDPETFKYTLEHLTKTHLFAKEKTIPNALYYLAKEMIKKHKDGIRDTDVDQNLKFIFELRHRISQSVKSFATAYYLAKKEGTAFKTPVQYDEEEGEEYQYQDMQRSSRIVDTVVKKICMYKTIDQRALSDAKGITKISSSLATIIVNEVSDVKYTDNVRAVLELFIKDAKGVEFICKDSYFSYVKSLMGIKRTTARIYFKQQVNVTLMTIVRNLKYEDKYDNLTSQTKFLVNSFLAYYITMVLRNTVC